MVSDMYLCERRSGLTEIESIGGLVHTVPTQPTVNTLSLPSLPLEVTITTGTGFKITLPFKSTFSFIIY